MKSKQRKRIYSWLDQNYKRGSIFAHGIFKKFVEIQKFFLSTERQTLFSRFSRRDPKTKKVSNFAEFLRNAAQSKNSNLANNFDQLENIFSIYFQFFVLRNFWHQNYELFNNFSICSQFLFVLCFSFQACIL